MSPSARQIRAELAQTMRAPMDPDDERAGVDHVDRAVMLVVGVAAAGGQRLGRASLVRESLTGQAALELGDYVRALLQDATDAGYDRGYDVGHADGITEGEARLDVALERERRGGGA